MTTYWKYQNAFDVGIAAIVTALSWTAGYLGLIIFSVSSERIALLSNSWLSSLVGLFGLVAATIAFVFSAIENEKFRVLRERKSQKQLWEILSSTLVVLLVSSIWCGLLSILTVDLIGSNFVVVVTTFFAYMTVLLMCKFTWALIQIIAVKASG